MLDKLWKINKNYDQNSLHKLKKYFNDKLYNENPNTILKT